MALLEATFVIVVDVLVVDVINVIVVALLVRWGVQSHFCVQPNLCVEVGLCCVVVGVATTPTTAISLLQGVHLYVSKVMREP